jgi:hypothetical protein
MKNNQVLAIVVVLLAALVILFLSDSKDSKTKPKNTSPPTVELPPFDISPILQREPANVPNRFISHMDASKNPAEKIFDLNSLELFNFTEGIGLRAKKDLKKDQVLAKINYNYPGVSMNILQILDDCKGLSVPKTEEDQHVWVALQLLFEKYKCDNKGTFMREYVDDVFKRLNFDSLGYFYSDKELNELQGSFLKDMILRQRNGIESLFQASKKSPVLKCFKFSPKCGKDIHWEKILTKKEFEMAFFVTFTRFFSAQIRYAPLNFEGKVKLLLPGIDYFNTHIHHPNAKQVISGKDFSVVAEKEIKKGEQVYLGYWKVTRSNELLMLTYGFCDDKNPNSLHRFGVGDYFYKRFESLPTDEMKKKVHQVLTKFKVFGFNVLSINKDPEMKLLDVEFLSLLRAFQTPIDQLEILKDLKFISTENENAALSEGIHIVRQILKGYPTTLIEDVELLKNFKGNQNLKCSIILRKEEKEILELLIQHLESKLTK